VLGQHLVERREEHFGYAMLLQLKNLLRRWRVYTLPYPIPMDLIGRTLDRYRIESKLGQGGMGVVYKARDTQLDRVVAIKVLPPEMMASPDRKQRFVQEARAASALNHPSIVTVYDVRSDAGVDFIVMEYVDGRTLDQTILSKGMGVTRSLRLAAQIADALSRAHEAGIVHRDLKPSNVIVTPDDRVKVLDFGVAKLLDPGEGAAEAATRSIPITDAGLAVGTAAYMSPEQAEGKKIDARSDIFSFGAVLYEMITGRRPFVGDSQVAILSKVLNEEPAAPSTFITSLPQDVERTILRCLRKDPGRRYQTMADLKVALDDLVTDSAATVSTQRIVARPALPWRWTWTVVIPAACSVAYLTWFMLQRPAAPAAPMNAVPLTAVPGVKRFPSFSPDGNHVTFTWTGTAQNNPDVYVQQIGAGTPLRITTDEAADSSPVWSPDGRSIAFLRQTSIPRQQEIRLIPPLGGPEKKLAEIRPRGFLRAVTMAWCPDSTCLLVTDAQGGEKPDALFVVLTRTGEKRQLTQPPSAAQADTDPAMSPDGKWLIFRRDLAPYSGQLQVVALAGDMTVRGEPRAVTSVLLTAYGPEWISNDEVLFYAKGALWRMRMAVGSAPERLPVGEDGLMPALSKPLEDGTRRLAYARSYADTNIWRIDTSGPGAPASTPAVLAVASTRGDVVGHLSRDGRRLTFMSDRSGESEVWASDVSGANAIQLTSLGAIPGFPRWSPDGQTVAFHSNAEDRPRGDVYLVTAEGGKLRNLTQHEANDVFASFSSDGRSVYFSSTRSGAPSVWKIPATGGDAVRVSTAVATFALESTNGEFLFYVETATGAGSGPLWQLPLNVPGGNAVKVMDNVPSTAFDVIDSGIYYVDQSEGDTRLQFYRFATRSSITVASKLGRVGPTITVSRDGRTIFFSRVDSATDDLMLVEKFR
jgi:Tol biopolymer transport system component/predicted Ser/Thr protein kinase